MNCKRAKTEIALWAGGDLEPESARSLQRHLAICPRCREHRDNLQHSLQLLQETQSATVTETRESIWPALARHLPTHDEIRRAERLNRWLPAAAALVASLALIAFTADRRPTENVTRRGLDGVPFETTPIQLDPTPSWQPSQVEGPPRRGRRRPDPFRELYPWEQGDPFGDPNDLPR